MARKKLRRFAELRELPNVLDKTHLSKGEDWIGEHFQTDLPLVVELGCGKGDYTLALARRFREKNILGIDKKGARLWKGARKAIEEGLQNAAFLRMKIEELGNYLLPSRVEQIWIPFPDPLPKRRQAKHRLISRPFLDAYQGFLKKGGQVHLKTDCTELITYLLELLEDYPVVIHRHVRNVHACTPDDSLLFCKTSYERKRLAAGETIKYLCFSFL